MVVSGGAAVDAHFPRAAHYRVYSDAQGPWDFTGNQTNVGNNNNKYYILQLLQPLRAGDGFVAWTRWGRVGATGQSAVIAEGSLAAAQAAFERKYADKTRNAWSDRPDFVAHPGKYDLVRIDYSAPPDAPQAPAVAKATPASKLAPGVLGLMELLFDVRALQGAVLELNYDASKLPLGRLTSQQIKLGYEALKDIEACINRADHGRALQDAVNAFYTRIPHVFGMRRPPPINTLQAVRDKVAMLQALDDIKVAMSMIEGENAALHPADSHYESLGCDIAPVAAADPDCAMVTRYMASTHGHTHNTYTLELVELYRVVRAGEFAETMGNKMLLWHGSRLTNWAGILGQGLRIAPPEAPTTGYMFGKGIYFADVVSKSANYCFASRDRNTALLLLCEVALGTTQELLDADSDMHQPAKRKGAHSTKGLGQFAPSTHVDWHGVTVPMGPLVDTGVRNPGGYTLNYNEFVVYDPKQVRFRFLVKVKFNYKGR